MAMFWGIPLGANETGLYRLDADDDDGTKISAEMELLPSDFGIENLKRLYKLYLGVDVSENLMVTVKGDNNISKPREAKIRHEGRQTLGVKPGSGRKGKARYWSVSIKNTNGGAMGIHSIKVLPQVMHNGTV